MKAKLAVLFTITLVVAGLSGTLAHRAQASRPAPLPPSPFVGTWQTTWTPHYNNPGDASKVSAPVTITADTGDPNALDGAVQVSKGPNGVMYGTVSLDGRVWTWKGNWWNNDGKYGSFNFKLTAPDSFTGTYRINGLDKDFDWHGSK